MIIVTGTKRAGTSMWMQILRAAGFPSIGEAFPRNWAESLGALNPNGFFESRFRDGIYHATNPDPETGFYVHPADVREHAVKIFVPGLTRTDLAYVDRVIVCVRDFREHHASLTQLHRAEAEHAEREPERDARGALPPALHVTPYLEWWYENHALLMDAFTRRYPLHVVSHERVVMDPERAIAEVLGWLGRGDVASAVRAVDSGLRHFDRSAADTGVLSTPEGLDPTHAETFDALYDRLHRGADFDGEFIDRLNDTHLALAARLDAERSIVEARRLERLRLVRDFERERSQALDLPERSET